MDFNKDIASGSWFEKWPEWLRWLCFLPFAIIGCLIASLLFMLLSSFGGADTSSGSLNGGWFRLLQSGVFGAAFVYIGAFIAPKYQIVVGVIMLMIAAILLTFTTTLIWSAQNENVPYIIMHVVATLIGGGAALYGVYDELSKP